MKSMTRRSFIKNSAAAAGAVAAAPLLYDGWINFAHAGPAGYFEDAFGISDVLCRRVLDRALTKGGDFADLYFENTIYP